jgi:hypothetical protein
LMRPAAEAPQPCNDSPLARFWYDKISEGYKACSGVQPTEKKTMKRTVGVSCASCPHSYVRDSRIKVTAALARITGISSPAGTPAGLSKHPTMSMIRAAHVVENKNSFRRPTLSIMNDPTGQLSAGSIGIPVKAPTMETAALTKFNSRCRSLSVIPARESKTGRKSSGQSTQSRLSDPPHTSQKTIPGKLAPYGHHHTKSETVSVASGSK